MLEPIREAGEIPSRTVNVPISLQFYDKFHTLPLSKQQTLSVIVEGFVQRSGTLAAQRWLEQQLETSPKHPPYPDDPPAHNALSLSSRSVSTRLESEPTRVHTAPVRFKLRPLPDTLSGSETASEDTLLDELVTE
ncbi:MAG: hypothetical protein ACRCYY_03625, partial [Trueperaceae bacterium]